MAYTKRITNYEKGKVVRLASNGPEMTITSVGFLYVKVSYFDSRGDFKRKYISKEALREWER